MCPEKTKFSNQNRKYDEGKMNGQDKIQDEKDRKTSEGGKE